MFASLKLGQFNGTPANTESFANVAGECGNFRGQKGDGGGLDDGRVLVAVELVQTGTNDLADFFAGVSRKVDFFWRNGCSKLEEKIQQNYIKCFS